MPSHLSVPFVERRGARALDQGFYPGLLSEVMASPLSVELAVAWRIEERNTMRKVWTNLPPDAYRTAATLLNRTHRKRLGITVYRDSTELEEALVERSRFLARPKAVTLDPLSTCDISTSHDCRLIDVKNCLVFKPNRRLPTILEIYSRDVHPAKQWCQLISALGSFCGAYLDSVQALQPAPEPIKAGQPHAISTQISLLDIQEILFRRLVARVGGAAKEAHVFVLDPQDDMLYFASTSHLRLQDTNVALNPLPRYKIEHVKKRIHSLAADHEKAAALLALYDQLLTPHVHPDTLRGKEELLKELLKFLPQELDTGVVGDAVYSRVLSIGGGTAWDDAQEATKEHFFSHKLRLEKAFGIASGGQIVAVPIYDTGQVAGSIFVVSHEEEPSARLKRALLDTSLDAGELISDYRRVTFLNAVIAGLRRRPNTDLAEIVGENLCFLFRYSLLLLIRDDFVKAAWWLPPHRRYNREPVPEQDLTTILQLPQIARLVGEKRPIVDIKGLETPFGRWWHGRGGTTIGATPKTALVVSFSRDVRFVLLVPEESDDVQLLSDALVQKTAIMQVLGQLPEVFRHAADYEEAQKLWAFSGHNLRRRWVDPIEALSHQIRSFSATLPYPASKALDSLTDDLELRIDILRSQFTFVSQGNSARPRAVDLSVVLNERLPVLFKTYLPSRVAETGCEAYRRVQLRVEVPPRIVVQGNEGDLLIAFFDLIENAVASYAISKEVLNVRAGQIEVSAVVASGEGMVHVSVSDNGLGMPKEIRDKYNRIFAAAAGGDRLEYTPPMTGGMTGKARPTLLGLQHAPYVFAQVGEGLRRGRVKIDSREGVGTVFHISLPVLQ